LRIDGSYPDILAAPGIQPGLFEKYTVNGKDPNAKCFEAPNASVDNAAFSTILNTTTLNSWFPDELVDFGLDLLERILECSKHKIALTTVSEATEFFNIRHWVEARRQNPDLIEAHDDDKITDEATGKFS
jgi:hypothetical protein